MSDHVRAVMDPTFSGSESSLSTAQKDPELDPHWSILQRPEGSTDHSVKKSWHQGRVVPAPGTAAGSSVDSDPAKIRSGAGSIVNKGPKSGSGAGTRGGSITALDHICSRYFPTLFKTNFLDQIGMWSYIQPLL